MLHALDVDLDEVGTPCAATKASSVVAGTSTRSSQRTHAKDGTRVASAMKPGQVVTVGVRELTSSVAAGCRDRLGAHGDLQVATEQPARKRAKSGSTATTGAQAGPGARAVADVGADVEAGPPAGTNGR